jgi:hypothetical protein
MIKNFSKYLLMISFLVIVLPLISWGQGIIDTNSLQISINPQNPEPGQIVKITINSFSFDINRSKNTFYIDGVKKKTEIGLKEFSVEAGKNGQKTTIKATAETTQGSVKEIEISFTPAVVDLIYEFLSYTPPFYKGKALNPNQGIVLVTAMPELIKISGVKIPAQDIIYSWKRNGKIDQNVSGLGKNTLFFQGTVPIRDSLVEVMASSLDNSVFASKQINITNDDPKIIFYEDSPIYGIMFNKAISGNVRMLADEFKVKVFPYFMSVGYAQSPDLSYKWSINSRISENLDEDKSAMVFRQEGIGSGLANISLKIENTLRIFQFSENNFVINFEKQ